MFNKEKIMALKLLNANMDRPLGQFDAVDGELQSFKGGEICSFAYVAEPTQMGVSQSGVDEAAYDDFDGYVNVAGTFKRPAVSKNWNGTVLVPATTRPLFLSDDGIFGYGTLFGAVVGGTVGQQVNGPNSYTGAVLGPSTQTASGKITLFHGPGLYAVSLDNTDVLLQPTSVALSGGDPLSFTTGGLLTPAAGANVASGAPVVGNFLEFVTNGSLVTTPNYLVAALNSPSGSVSSLYARQFQWATFYFTA